MIGLRIQIQTDLDLSPEIENLIDDVANAVPEAFRFGVDSQTPKGRLYRRGNITGRLTKRGLKSGFKQTAKTRMAVGSRFHRASAKGQFPAKDSGDLYKNIRVVKRGKFGRAVIFASPHAGFAEEQRPFMSKVADLVVQRFI